MNRADSLDVRPAAVAGLFYPGDRAVLEAELGALLDEARTDAPAPKALIVPHAGYVYSGPVAASAYALLAGARGAVGRVVLLGPSHRVPLDGMAVPTVGAFETPLGRTPIDRDAMRALGAHPRVRAHDAPHASDHALEVQIPFLQHMLGAFSLVPIAVGRCTATDVADALDVVWGGSETLIVVSTDLSHFHAYDEARTLDAATVAAIVRRETAIVSEQACGCHALNGLLLAARRRELAVRLLDLRNSGDTAGDRRRVVGYASFAVDAH